ncbi:hypothetical protein [Wenjunlia tyrosinilytica]|uniref:Secreted protein n=1 Tax=Wenjunlia tyrosinilytica TaxID=1544741 RepID=A0A917ZXI9_9ACTN|nr:hypothetical protein [Wenjunlia tyrosinilytica]GGO97121.1 hypothetical protein GCM10012280_58170 [Wenjunlia tyrosinilytica]
MAVCGAAALGVTLAGTMVPTASANPDNYIGFRNDSGYFVDTCYAWKGPAGIESKNYCHWARTVGTKWQAHFPEEATGVTVTVNFTGSHSEPVYIDNADSSHCYQITGVWPNGHLLKVQC